MQLGNCTVYIDHPNEENPFYPLSLDNQLCTCTVNFTAESQKLLLESCVTINASLIMRYFRSGSLFSRDSERAVTLTVQGNSDRDFIIRFICAVPESSQGSAMSFICYKRTFQNKQAHFVSG